MVDESRFKPKAKVAKCQMALNIGYAGIPKSIIIQSMIIQYHSWFIVIIDTMMCSLLFENRSVWIINTASKAVVV